MNMDNQQGTGTLYDKLIEWRDTDRDRKRNGLIIVKGNELPLENNPQGLMQWYMHPAMNHVSMNSMLVFVQEIPPNSSSGKQKTPGGINIYIWQGRGHTILDGIRYEWKAEDVVQIPSRPEGALVQHFNTDPEETVKLLVVEANLIDALGVDRGAGFEQLQVAPTFRK
jgi:gentisate 1,2-dioxygenase